MVYVYTKTSHQHSAAAILYHIKDAYDIDCMHKRGM